MSAKELYERILEYSSPIDVIFGKWQIEVQEDVLKAVQQIGIDVDKEELLKALKYDRDQYLKGYSCGVNKGYTKGQKEMAKSIISILNVEKGLRPNTVTDYPDRIDNVIAFIKKEFCTEVNDNE